MSELVQIVSPEVRLRTIEEWKEAQEAKEAALHGPVEAEAQSEENEGE